VRAVTASGALTTSDSFNHDFYVVAATVIPVLFLALAVQGPLFVRVFRGYQRVAHLPAAERRNGMLEIRGPLYRALFGATSWLLVLLLALTVLAGGWGELLAVYAVYQQQDQASTRQIVLLLTLFLIIAVPGVAVMTFAGVLCSTSPRKTDDARDGDADDAQSRDEVLGDQGSTREATVLAVTEPRTTPETESAEPGT
jgi:hypothetical protein